MRVAIVHDWLVSYAGAEKVLEQILDLYPHADLFSLISFLDSDDFILNKKVKTSFLQKIPRAKSSYRNYLPLMPFAIEQFDLGGYDLIISSSHAVAKGVISGPDQLHICYCHSPIRYAWDLQNQYLAEAGIDRKLSGWLARWILFKLRNWDYRSANGVDYFISNSNYIARRIKKIYRREAVTIYPGVSIDDFDVLENKEDFYLTASRMVPYKKMGLIAEAFANMPDKKLFVIGDGPQIDQVKKYARKNVIVLGYQPFDVLKDYMRRAKAFVFAAEEDFGIIPVEVQACGTPVIAFAKGGALETVIDGETGVLFSEQTTSSIQDAVTRFESGFSSNAVRIREHAEKFSTERFRKEFKNFVDSKVDDFFKYRS